MPPRNNILITRIGKKMNISWKLFQGHELKHAGGSALEVPLRRAYGSTDIRRGRSRMP